MPKTERVKLNKKMKLEILTPEEERIIDELNDPFMIGETCLYLPRIKVGIKLDDGTLVGMLILFNVQFDHRKAEFGIQIIDSRGTLLAVKAFKQFIKDVFEWGNLNRVYSRIQHDNERCLSCAKRVGFQYEGTERRSLFVNGVWKDVVVMSILREEVV
jgi:RimJ/RimL family protein N-acetyltransferase